MENMKYLTVTLNPAVDKTYRTQELFCGRVNRMRSVDNMPGGKGINVSRILIQYGAQVTATGFLGGYPGKWIASGLEKLGIENAFVEIEEETRSSINVVADDGYVTEILEPGPLIGEEQLSAFLERFSGLVRECGLLILSGSAARGIPADIYARLIREAREAGKEVILDTSQDLLREGIKAAPSLVKPNRRELEYVIGHRLQDREDLKEAAEVLRKNGVHRVAVSLGSKGLMLMGESGCLYAPAPSVKTVNTVGCGDSVVASLAMSLASGADEEEMLRRAAAASAASAAVFESGVVPMDLADSLYEQVSVIRI